MEMVQKYTIEELSQISYSTSFMFEAAKLTLLQLYGNPSAIKLMNAIDLSELEAGDLLRQVGVVNINVPFVNSIYIFNRAAGKMYYDGKAFPVDTFPDRDMINRLDNRGSIRNLQPLARQIPNPSRYIGVSPESAELVDVYSFLFSDSYTAQIDSAIILNVSQEWMKHTIESMNPEISSETVIADSDGTVMLSNVHSGYLENINNQADFSEILNDPAPSGYALRTIQGHKYLVTYVTVAPLDWTYIRLTPYEAITGQISQIMITTLVIFIAVTVLSVLSVMLLSKSVNGFVNRKLSDVEKKYAAEKKTGYEKKQQFLRLLATRGVEETRLADDLSRYKIQFSPDPSFMVMMLRVDGYKAYCAKYTPEDRKLLAYGVMNIAGELTGSLFTHEAVDLEDGYIAIIFHVDRQQDEAFTIKLEELALQIQDKVNHFLGVSCSAALGDMQEELGDIPDSVAECREALDYKLFDGPRAILYTSRIKEIKRKSHVFPEEDMETLVEHIWAGEKENASVCCRQIVESTRGYSIASLQTTVLQLVIRLKDSLQKVTLLAEEVHYDGVISVATHVIRCETLEEIHARLESLLTEIFDVLSRSREAVKRHERYSGILEQVSGLIAEQFADPNLNPELLAERLGLSAKYLRTLYKKASGETLGEAINHYRMEHSRALLAQTEASVQEIALQCGYANSNYFYTLFKKYNAMTPNEFRNVALHRNADEGSV
jgi:AraC-like DNA-binding protein